MSGTVLIAGASGVVGFSALEAYLEQTDFEVITLSRRRPQPRSERRFEHLALDLRDAAACAAAAEQFAGVTHVVYAALYEKPGLVPGWQEQDQMQTNLAMLRNLMEPLGAAASDLRHVSLLQGTKAYGVHIHPIPIPARERAPRDDHANFYWLQEDYLRAKAATLGFGFTILRPQITVGGPYGVAMNLPPVIGAYAAICREEGRPFGFPGGPSWVLEAVDARLLADVLLWAGRTEEAWGEHFNVTNGDVFEWRSLWPSFARTLGVELGPDSPVALSTFLPSKAEVWRRIADRHGLRVREIGELLGESHHYADFCFAYGARQPGPPVFVSTVKLRQAGFCEAIDTEDMFRDWFEYLIDTKVLPPADSRPGVSSERAASGVA